MTLVEQLKHARKALVAGWVGGAGEPWCRDSRGRRVHHTDEGVFTFSVLGALQLHGELGPALELLGRVVSPGLAALNDFMSTHSFEQLQSLRWESERDWFARLDGRATAYELLEEEWWQLQVRAAGEHLTFGDWLVQKGRTAEDVLRVFTTAVLRSSREKRT